MAQDDAVLADLTSARRGHNAGREGQQRAGQWHEMQIHLQWPQGIPHCQNIQPGVPPQRETKKQVRCPHAWTTACGTSALVKRRTCTAERSFAPSSSNSVSRFFPPSGLRASGGMWYSR